MLLLSALMCAVPAYASQLTYRQDFVSPGAPSYVADHTIIFRTVNVIPASGTIYLTSVSSSFVIPAGLGIEDVDVLVGGTQINLATSAGTSAGSAWGVSIQSGTPGSITFTLNNTDTLSAGSEVTVRIGLNATYQLTSNTQITNPATTGMHPFYVTTKNASATEIDSGTVIGYLTDSINVGTSFENTQAPPGAMSPAGEWRPSSAPVHIIEEKPIKKKEFETPFSLDKKGVIKFYDEDRNDSVIMRWIPLDERDVLMNGGETMLGSDGLEITIPGGTCEGCTLTIPEGERIHQGRIEQIYYFDPIRGEWRSIPFIRTDAGVTIPDLHEGVYIFTQKRNTQKNNPDLNHDGRVDISDASILFYHWDTFQSWIELVIFKTFWH